MEMNNGRGYIKVCENKENEQQHVDFEKQRAIKMIQEADTFLVITRASDKHAVISVVPPSDFFNILGCMKDWCDLFSQQMKKMAHPRENTDSLDDKK